MTAVADPRLYIVIPVRDRCRLTRACLLALQAQTYRNATVIVVDDGSTDGTRQMLSNEFPTATVLEGRGDLWWTGATNLGCAWVLERAKDTDAVVTLNDDTVPGPHWLARLQTAAQAHPRALVGSVAVAGPEKRIESATISIDWWTAKYSDPYRGADLASLRSRAPSVLDSAALSGKGTLVPVRALRELGLYAARLPHYAADYEFSIRAARRGWRLLVATQAELEVLPETTGLHASTMADLPLMVRSLWSRRSANAIRYRVRFAQLACPGAALLPFIACDLTRVLVHSGRTLRHR